MTRLWQYMRSWFVKKRPLYEPPPWYWESDQKRAKAKEARKELKRKMK